MSSQTAIDQRSSRETAATAEHLPMLSDLEWKVVSLAMREAGQACVRETGALGHRLRAFWSAVTGWEPKRPLADPRLELLRRYVCTQAGRRDARELATRLIAHGFTQGQLQAVALLARA